MSTRYRKIQSQTPPRQQVKKKEITTQISPKSDYEGTKDLIRTTLTIIAINFLLSYYITGTWWWTYDSKLFQIRYLNSSTLFTATFFNFTYPRTFTDSSLSIYSGLDPKLPIYVAINGSVFDVSQNAATYGPGGPYNIFAGRDATRAFVTGCFTSDLTFDLRGLSAEKVENDIKHWHSFFANNPRYWYVGQVVHDPILGPPPGPCQSRAIQQKPGVRSKGKVV
ncbi:cytochrome b5-like heme/steroid binding domain-containing protein [Lipomyces oligophaga]|uniref:cytochrome b5-like heme/steroid binding domain-containing protein n=1 Tax=Lipomyces oligophaga TaxID=45792 RepID=UPI0034CE0C81